MATSLQRIFLPQGTAVDLGFVGDTIPGVDQVLIAFTIPAGIARRFLRVRVNCRAHADWRLLVGVDEVANGKIGPGHLTDDYVFEDKVINGLITGELRLKTSPDFPITSVEARIYASDDTV